MLKHYRTLIRKHDRELPSGLSLLNVRVAGRAEDAAHSEPWGRTEGVIADVDRAEVAYFVVRVHAEGSPSRRILVPVEAIEVVYPEAGRSLEDAVLQVEWTPDQLRAQPSFNADGMLPVDRRTGGPPVTGRWLPARPVGVAPGSQTSWAK